MDSAKTASNHFDTQEVYDDSHLSPSRGDAPRAPCWFWRASLSEPSFAQTPAAGPVALTGARLIDGTGGAPLEQATVVIRNGRIEAAGAAAAVTVPSGATRVDLVREDDHAGDHQRARPSGRGCVQPTRPRQTGRSTPRVRRLRRHDRGRPRDPSQRSPGRRQAARRTRARNARSCSSVSRRHEPQRSEDGRGSAGKGRCLRGRESVPHQAAHHRRPERHDAGGLRGPHRSGPQTRTQGRSPSCTI